MAELIKCFECGADVSSEAGACPKCSHPVHGYTCRICQTRGKIFVDLHYYKFSYVIADREYGALAHRECFESIAKELFSVRITCSVCNRYEYHVNINKCEIFRCAICGHSYFYATQYDSDSAYLCMVCQLPLIPICSISYGNNRFLHQFCCNKNKREAYRLSQYSGYISINIDSNTIDNFASQALDLINKRMKQESCFFATDIEIDGYIINIDSKVKPDQPKENSTCFIATALYGEDSSKVQMLCFFRDEYLSASSIGRAFIALYVRLSPPLARAIAKESLLRSLVRFCIVAPALLFTEKFLAYVGRKGNSKI